MSKMTRTAWGLESLPEGEWLQHAACTPDTAHLFEAWGRANSTINSLSRNNEKALTICGRCPAVAECLADAIAHPTDDWLIRAGHLVHRGQTYRAVPRHHPAPRPEPEPEAKPPTTDFAVAVSELVDLGWSNERIATALGIGVTAVRRYALIGGR